MRHIIMQINPLWYVSEISKESETKLPNRTNSICILLYEIFLFATYSPKSQLVPL